MYGGDFSLCGYHQAHSPAPLWEDWRYNPFRLVSLMEILRFHAHAFGAVLGLFGQIWTLIDKTGNLSPANGEMLARAVGELNRQCETLHLRSSQHLIGHFLDDLPGIHAFTEISARIKAMHRMVID